MQGGQAQGLQVGCRSGHEAGQAAHGVSPCSGALQAGVERERGEGLCHLLRQEVRMPTEPYHGPTLSPPAPLSSASVPCAPSPPPLPPTLVHPTAPYHPPLCHMMHIPQRSSCPYTHTHTHFSPFYTRPQQRFLCPTGLPITCTSSMRMTTGQRPVTCGSDVPGPLPHNSDGCSTHPCLFSGF